MKEFPEILKTFPNILKEASKSPLGIVALVVLLISIVAAVFFNQSSDIMKLSVFAICVASLVFLVVCIFKFQQPHGKVISEDKDPSDQINHKSGTRKQIVETDRIDKSIEYQATIESIYKDFIRHLRNLLLFLEKRYRTHPYNGNYGGWFQFLEREWREDELPGMFGTAIATRLSCLILNILSECGENTLWFHKEDKIQHGITWLLKNRNPDGSFRMPM